MVGWPTDDHPELWVDADKALTFISYPYALDLQAMKEVPAAVPHG